MSYISLYRKYRPKVFGDVIGQEHILKTLCNQIASGRINHAYLFTGSRGTGKTLCARIFSRSVNCLSPIEGSPCGECVVCHALDVANDIDIIEIDAASNNKVDEIRELREQIKYPPVKGKYKVYIVDEVHMLTDSAFNALLKTLEEPPEYAIFILATTEAHKLPATILSRCLRFDFRLLSIGELEILLERIYKAEGKAFEKEALSYIASAAAGSARDCLSIADMCINYSQDKLTLEDVLTVLGAADKSKIGALFGCIADGDVGNVLRHIDILANSGKSMSLIVKEVTRYARDLLVIKTTGDILVTDTKENIARMTAEAQKYSVDLLVTVIKEFSKSEPELRYSISPRIVLETAAINVCRLNTLDLSVLSERIRRLEEIGVSYAAPQSVAAKAVANENIATKTRNASQPQNATEQVQNMSGDTAQTKPMDAKSVWGRMTTYFRQKGMMGLFTLVGEHFDYSIEGDKLVICATDERFLQFSDEDNLRGINEALLADGTPYTVKVVKNEKDVDMDDEISALKKMIGKAKLNIIK